MRLSDLPHLVRRFFGSLGAGAATPAEQRAVAALLTTDEAAVFWAQPRPDVRHALDSLARLRGEGPAEPALERAVLLHDVGKRHSGLGILGRSLASGLAILHLPRSERMRRYLDHGELGAAELEALGAGALEVAFARHHHGARPDGTDPGRWERLVAADAE
jgi:hypothetical protein